MLPPMGIFFPLFTILEDLGYLPRVAFNLDHRFKKAGCNGKQCLTMCMGFGCNASGVIGTRIINSPRERLIAVLTNNFVPCNGRFPLIFLMAACFFTGFSSAFANAVVPAVIAVCVILFGVVITLLVSKFLSVTFLKGIPSAFTLELPPYRKPNILQILYTSLISRTLFVLGRAILIAAPTGAVIWLLSNTFSGGHSLIQILSDFMDPFGRVLGMDGVIILAFILAFPANEIVLPIILMTYTAGSHLTDIGSVSDIFATLSGHGWTWMTAVCVLLFSLLHYPCSTTLLTIRKETGSLKWTFLAFALPTAIAIAATIFTSMIFRILS
jgi:ferrous iron transport protein B